MKIEFMPTDANGRDYPPIPMKKAVPNWYKEMPTEVGPRNAAWFQSRDAQTNATIRKCAPVLDYLTSGYVLRNQTEILISSLITEETQEVFWRHACSDKATVSHHPHEQCPVKIQNENKIYVKIRCGFVIKTPPGYSCAFYQSPYFLHEGFEFFPAIVDTDVYDGEIFFPGYVSAGYEHLNFAPGTPLVTVFPFKRESWEGIVHQKPVNSEGDKFTKHKTTWIDEIYRRFVRQEKEYK